MHARCPDLGSGRSPLAFTFHVALPVWMDWDIFTCYSFLSTPGSDAFSSGSVVPSSGWNRAEGARTQVSREGDKVKTACKVGPELDYCLGNAREEYAIKHIGICIPAVDRVP